MGYTTDFIGHINVKPVLNSAEQMYLTAFAESRRYDRERGPYEVPGNPAAEHSQDIEGIDRYSDLAPGQPSLWCDWTPCWEGCCLAHNGHEKSYNATRWLTYLIDHFLAPGAFAATSGLHMFDEFTFDHRLDGVIAACRRDNRELYHIRVRDNLVSEETIVAGDLLDYDLPRLPYEEQRDRSRKRRGRRRSGSVGT